MDNYVKLYIVDDEKMAIEYFKRLIEGLSPACIVVGEALHGPTALEEIPKVQPDIVFVDISMPVMNGLVLAERILQQNKNQIIVLLTSYREFDYVKRGMELGVSNYLLKNELTPESLGKEIRSIMEQVRLERKRLHTYQEYNLKQFLESESSRTEGMENIYKGSTLNRFALTAVKRIHPVCMQAVYEEHVNFESMQLEELEYPEGITCRGAVRLSEEMWAAVFFIHEVVSDSTVLLEQSAGKMLQLYKKAGIPVSAIISDVFRNFTDLPQAYRRISRLSQHMLCMGRDRIYHQNDVENVLRADRQTEVYMSDLVGILDAEKETEAKALIDRLFEEAAAYTIQEFTRMLQELHGVIKRYAMRKKVDINAIPVQNEFYSAGEAREYMQKMVSGIFHHLREQDEKHYSRNVLLILEYIQQHYAENISLQDIAEAVQLSEGHTRKCFKQEIGTTVVDYLTEYRINRAKELIKNGERITSVYEKAGFTSSQYFSYVFKKYEGISPSEYARRLR